MDWLKERGQSLVSKKLGAAVAGGSIAMAAEGPAQGAALTLTAVYILAQAAVDFAAKLKE